jgi:hypothetical protein
VDELSSRACAALDVLPDLESLLGQILSFLLCHFQNKITSHYFSEARNFKRLLGSVGEDNLPRWILQHSIALAFYMCEPFAVV